jgi:hypothetical protein
MLGFLILALPQHHGETVDPALLAIIKETLDHLFDLGPWTIVVILGSLITVLPLVLVGFYLWQQRRVGPERHEIPS